MVPAFQQVLRRHSLQSLRLAQPGHGVGLPLAHVLHEPGNGVAALFIDPGGDGVGQVQGLPLHKIPDKAARFQAGLEQKLPEQLHHLGEQRLAARVAVLQKIQIKAHALDLALFPDQGAHAGPVQLVQPLGDGLHIRVIPAAAKQDAGNQGVGRRVRISQGPEQIDAEAARFKPVRLDRVEPDPRQNGNSIGRHNHIPFYGVIIIHQNDRIVK